MTLTLKTHRVCLCLIGAKCHTAVNPSGYVFSSHTLICILWILFYSRGSVFYVVTLVLNVCERKQYEELVYF